MACNSLVLLAKCFSVLFVVVYFSPPGGLCAKRYAHRPSRRILVRERDRSLRKQKNLVAFNEPDGGYVQHSPIDINGDIDLRFRFRTVEADGVMIHTSNADKFVSVMLVSGAVHLVANNSEHGITVGSRLDTYNDGKWHVVKVVKRGRTLILDVDDNVSRNRFPKKSSRNKGLFFIGGFPDVELVKEANYLPTTSNFIGCISDVGVGSETVSLKNNILSANNITYDVCPVGSVQPNATTPIERVGPGTSIPPTVAVKDEGALQFGTTPESRQEFPPLETTFKRMMVMRVELKTVARDGLIMYTSDRRHIDFTAAYLRDGKVVFGWDYGSGPLLLESPETVNDGKWHTIVMKRNQALGELFIDGELVQYDQIRGDNRFFAPNTPVFFGGIDPALVDNIYTYRVDAQSRTSFVGCLRGFALGMTEADRPIGEPDRVVDVQPCTGIIEPGVFFGNNSYLEQTSVYSIGAHFEMRMSIRPRVTTAVLMSVQGQLGDFLSLEMVDGVLYLRCQNGAGVIEASYSPSEGAFHLCDGNWHDIIVEKSSNLVSLTVDGELGEIGTGDPLAISADTWDPMYFGGIPDEALHHGLTTKARYMGCMRDVEIRGDRQNFNDAVSITGDVNTMSCPHG